MQLVSNFLGIEPITSIEKWCKKEKKRKDILCTQIVKQYNKSMGEVDLADMLIALYRIPCKTKRWYQKLFWYLVDIAKKNAWLLYRWHYQQHEDGTKNQALIQNLKHWFIQTNWNRVVQVEDHQNDEVQNQ